MLNMNVHFLHYELVALRCMNVNLMVPNIVLFLSTLPLIHKKKVWADVDSISQIEIMFF